jgi:hypothetical protein
MDNLEVDWLPFLAWIFQVAGTMSVAAGKKVILAGGALASHIVWVVSGDVTANAGSHLEGVILGKTSISLLTGATANSRLLAQTFVALQQVSLRSSRLLCELVVKFIAFPGYCYQLNGQGYFDAALTFDACSVSLRQLNIASMVELIFSAILEV